MEGEISSHSLSLLSTYNYSSSDEELVEATTSAESNYFGFDQKSSATLDQCLEIIQEEQRKNTSLYAVPGKNIKIL